MTEKKQDKKYSKNEVIKFGDSFPDRGNFCPKCKTNIPEFEDMTPELESRVLKLIRDGKRLMAMVELQSALACSTRWSKIWVIHSGKPSPDYPGPPCPYCSKSLKTSLAKYCLHCQNYWREK